jgi:hypothetical protein
MVLHGLSARAVGTAPLEQLLESRSARLPGWRPTAPLSTVVLVLYPFSFVADPDSGVNRRRCHA